MPYKISELKAKWNKEKDCYRAQELGTGVHSFIKDFLENEDLFRLREGKLSGKDVSRKNEYIHENKAKEGRKADFVIYINPEIVIPLEAESYGNIQAGIKQLFDYQKDFDKHYGILTDGFTWRFYNNNIYRQFNLNQIFDETDIFLEFWKEYIKPEFYYLSFFEPQGQQSLLKEADKLPVDEHRQIFFEDITKLIKSFQKKLEVEGYFNGLDKKEGIKRAIEITYAYIIQFILYKTLVDNGFGEFDSEFKEITKAIHESLKIKQYGKILAIIEGISNKISQNIYHPFRKEQEFINQTVFALIRQPKNELKEVSPWLDIFVFIKKYYFANIQNEIFGYIYENYLKELYEDTKKGQYFTDPAVVNFMLQQVGFTPEVLQKRYQHDKDSVSLIDPSCGSGTFLYSAVDSILKAFGNNSEGKSKQIEAIVNNNIFGLDIAEFPLYLAEMNILMRMLPLIINEKYNNPVDKKINLFWTQDSIAEFIFSNLDNTQNDQFIREDKTISEEKSAARELFDLSFYKKAIKPELPSFMRDEAEVIELIKSMKPPRRRFDFVIGNPPYVGYNECSKQKVLVFELMKQGEPKLNNIYGFNFHSIPNNQKKHSPKPNLYAFFIALGVALLKDNGRLCYIIPQTLLTAGDLDVLRYHLAKFTTIEKVITFSGKMFVGRGLKQNKPVATSSLVFVINREAPSTLHQVEVVNYANPNDDIDKTLKNILANKKVTKKKILQSEFLQNVANWNFIRQDKALLGFYREYKDNTEDISIYYNHALAEHKFKSKFFFDIGYEINERLLSSEPISNGYQYPKIDERFWTIKSIRGYWPNERNKGSKLQIKLLTTNQGYNLLDSPYKILWSYINPKKFHFSSLPLIWARNQICSVGSKNKEELLYLLSLLNSPMNLKLLNSFLKSENEKDLLISLTSVKEFVRVPKITENNQRIKNEIIRRTEGMLTLEDKTLSNFIDFSKVLVQKFDSVIIKDDSLVLRKDEKEIELQIKDNLDLIKKIIDGNYGNQKLDIEEKQILLADLKSLPVIDFDKQRALKDHIDDLVFALYFNVPLNSSDVKSPTVVQKECSRNKYYRLVDPKLGKEN